MSEILKCNNCGKEIKKFHKIMKENVKWDTEYTINKNDYYDETDEIAFGDVYEEYLICDNCNKILDPDLQGELYRLME